MEIMTCEDFFKQCKNDEQYNMFIDKKAWDELIERFAIKYIEKGLCFGNEIINRMVEQTFMDMDVPFECSHLVVDHCYTLTGNCGRQYCIINPYYGPGNKEKLMKIVEKSLNKAFEHGIEEAESNRQFDNIYVWDTGLYNPNQTIGIFIAENPVIFEFIHKLENVSDMLVGIDSSKLKKRDQVKHNKAIRALRNIENIADVNSPIMRTKFDD